MATSGQVRAMVWAAALLGGPVVAADAVRAPAAGAGTPVAAVPHASTGAVRTRAETAKTPPRAAPPAASAGAGTAALTAGGRTIAADDVARVERRIEARPSTTIWQARLPDGTLELTDRPPAPGASAVQSRSYALPSDDQARQRAEAERAYWRKQAEAFEARRSERERARERPVAPATTVIMQADSDRPRVYHGYGWLPPDVIGGSRPMVPVVLPAYGSPPGAVQGRDGGFIGSGFSTRR